MKKLLGTAVIASSLVGFHANAQTVEPYAGVDVGFLDLGFDEISDEASLTALIGRGGVKFAENFAVEGRIGFGIADDDIAGVDLSLNYLAGVYLLAGIPVTEQFFPYAVLGYSKGDFDIDSALGSDSDSESDLSYGVGVKFNLNETFAINGEYMNYLDKDGGELSGFTIGATLSF